jgi:hypothetical protein
MLLESLFGSSESILMIQVTLYGFMLVASNHLFLLSATVYSDRLVLCSGYN